MKKLLLFALVFITVYFLVHSLSDFGISFSEAWTGLFITGLTFLTYVALIMKRV